MKKVFSIIIALICMHICFSQDLSNDFIEYSNHINEAGINIQKAQGDLTASIASAILGGACIYWAGSITSSNSEEKAIMQYALAGAFGVSTISFYIAHIIHMNKAGKELQEANKIIINKSNSISFNTSQNGIGIALNF